MDQSLRQRGWSIHSSEDHVSHSTSQENHQRPRADSHMTCDTEPSLSEAEKLHLLNSAFEDEEGVDTTADAAARYKNNKSAIKANESHSGDEEGGEDHLDMFGGGEQSDENDEGGGGALTTLLLLAKSPKEPPKKRRKTGTGESVAADNDNNSKSDGSDDSDSSDDNESEADDGDKKTKTQKRPHIKLTQKQQEQLDLAKNKLSKWAARLFDPNRPRGLVEAPKVIPLNDEFLTAFGKREKEYDDLAGREIDIDKTSLDIIDVDEDSDDDNEGESKKKSKKDETAKKRNFSEMSNCKVKFSNLSYNTTTATIARKCGNIGPVVDVNLIVDDNGQSSGRAYVVFEDHETAERCTSQMNQTQFEGRTLYVTLAAASGRKSNSSGPAKKQDSRYWERDISTKCNSCGQVGHIARNCPNEEKLKPCGLCAELGHEMWTCPQKSICFNCGLPGHVSRECNQRRGLPQRVVCTVCYRSGHHRFDCRERPWNTPSQDAICMQCGEVGHTMCSRMKWFFGLKGVTCFNCGERNHRGIECRKPNVNDCKDANVAQNQIAMAGAYSL